MKTLITLALLTASTAFATEQEQNKKTVTEFYEMAFNKHQAREAAMKYLAVNYIQHNPGVGDGRQSFIDAFAQSKGPDDSVVEFKRVIAEGDLVVLHSHGHEHPGDLGYAVVDIFRVNKGVITEHWDVGQKVSAKPKNTNTMF
jgi:predicted SnoaL-like aldol condensation-catalyzing enzyme